MIRRLVRLVVALSVVTVALPEGLVSAALSASEKNEAKKGWRAGLDVNQGMSLALLPIVYNTTTANRRAISEIWDSTRRARGALHRGNALLLGINPEAAGSAPYTAREQTGRTVWVRDAFAEHDTAITELTSALAALARAGAIAGQAATYYDNLDRYTRYLATAQNNLKSINRAPGYSTPRATGHEPHIVKPHGDFVRATNLVFEAEKQANLGLQILREVYTANLASEPELPTRTNTAFGDFVRDLAELSVKFSAVQYAWALIPLNDVQCRFSDFHMTSRVTEVLLQVGSESQSQTPPDLGGPIGGAPYVFHGGATLKSKRLDLIRPTLPSRPQTHERWDAFIATWLKIWMHADGAMWEFLEFPAGVSLSRLRAQATSPSADRVPPLCPNAGSARATPGRESTTVPGVSHGGLGLTTAEKTEVTKGYAAGRDVNDGLASFGRALNETTTATRPPLANIWDLLRRIRRDIHWGNALLIGVNPEDEDAPPCPPGNCPTTSRENSPRATWVAGAFAAHDGAIANLISTVTSVNRALAIGGQTSEYYTNLNTLKAQLASARAKLQGIRRSLTYREPRNTPWWPRALGPHGNLLAMLDFVFEGEKALNTSLETLRDVYTAKLGAEPELPTSTNPAFARLVSDSGKISDALSIVQFNLMMVALTDVQCMFSSFHLASRATEYLFQHGTSRTPAAHGGPIEGVPFLFNAGGNFKTDVLDPLRAAFADRPQTHERWDEFVNNRVQAWRFIDGGGWAFFEFPPDVTIGSGNGRTTVFPYATPIADAAHLSVYRDSLRLTLGVDYTVSGVGSATGGSVALRVPPPPLSKLYITRVVNTTLETLRRQPPPENDPDAPSVCPPPPSR